MITVYMKTTFVNVEAVESTEEPPPLKKKAPLLNAPTVSDELVVLNNDSKLHKRGKSLTRAFIVDSSNFACRNLTSQIFNSYEQSFALMFAALHLAEPQKCGESDMLIDKGLLGPLNVAHFPLV
jgi:hypothetical protein